MQYEKLDLYGGAITSQFPAGLVDASNLRQIPDNQELFLTPSENTTDYSQLNKNDSIIVELMEKLDTTTDQEAILEHFKEISQINASGNEWRLLSTQSVESSIDSAYISIGLEPARKWGRDESKGKDFTPTLVVILGLIRINKVETDLLVTYNLMIDNKKELTDLEKVVDQGDFKLDNNDASKRIILGTQVVETALKNMKVEEWSLFG